MKFLIMIMLSCGAFLAGRAQSQIGIPEISTYSNRDYKAGLQNWDVKQDPKGILYFANYDGLLTFNGVSWELFPLPNNTAVRSVEIGRDGKIYVGAQNAIGYFIPSESGTLHYHSLNELIPVEERGFADIWNIAIVGSDVFFCSPDKIFQLREGKIQVWKSGSGWLAMTAVNNQLYVQEHLKGLMRFTDGHLTLVSSDPVLKNEQVTSILSFDRSTLLIATLKKGLFRLKDSTLTEQPVAAECRLSANRIFSVRKLDNGSFVLGTTNGECFILNKTGAVIQNFSVPGGCIRKILVDAEADLWFCMDAGISFAAINSAVKNIYPDPVKPLSTFAIKIADARLFIGTSNGLSSCSLDTRQKDLSFTRAAFTEITKVKGQVWELDALNGQLLIGHEDGAYGISAGILYKFITTTGTWLFEPVDTGSRVKELLAGTYDGIHLLRNVNGKFIDKGHIDGFTEPLRFLRLERNTDIIWASHPYRGIYRIRLSSDHRKILSYTLYTEKNGLPSDQNNYLFEVRGKIITATEKGIYEYNILHDRMEPSGFLHDIFKSETVQYLTDDSNRNIWFVADKRVGVVDFSRPAGGKPYSVIIFPELSARMVSRFQKIYPYNNENVFIACDKGVVHLNYTKYTQERDSITCILTNIRSGGPGDSILYGGFSIRKAGSRAPATGNEATISHSMNSLHFGYASTSFARLKNIEYSYKLIGFDDEWSAWTEKTEKDYTNLPPGSYQFVVRSGNNLGMVSRPAFYNFTIRAAWYQTLYAFLIYLLGLSSAIYFFLDWQKKKQQRSEANLRYVHQLQLENSERQLIKLRNEKLEEKVAHKNRELTTTAMHLVQRGKLLNLIRDEWLELVKTEACIGSTEQSKRIMRLINAAEKNDADWEHFSVHFDQVHSSFLSTLKFLFPELSRNDLKMCAYMKMNLSSKEIAQLTNVSIRAVEVSRYRLRKKLPICTESSLIDYLLKVTSQVKNTGLSGDSPF